MLKLPEGIHVVGEGPAVVLFHSSLSSSKQWLPLVSILKSHYKIINIDMLGYGSADKVVDKAHYNFTAELQRVYSALESILEGEHYHLVGHSCGGALALKMAVEHPQKVLSLSLYEPVAFHLLEDGSQAQEVSNRFADEVNVKDGYLAAEKFTDFWNKKGFFNALPEKMQRLMASDMEKVNLDFIGLTSERYTLNDVNNIKAPVLMMAGEYSPDLSKDLASTIGSSFDSVKSMYFKSGHMGPVSHASIIHPAIAEFIHENS